MPLSKLLLLIGTPILYIWHYLFSWLFYKFEKKKIRDDVRKFGAEFAFVGISFFAAALLDTTSRFYVALKEHSDETVVWVAVFSILTLFIFDATAVLLYKTYEEKKKKNRQGLWRLWLSYVLGLVTLGISISLI